MTLLTSHFLCFQEMQDDDFITWGNVRSLTSIISTKKENTEIADLEITKEEADTPHSNEKIASRVQDIETAPLPSHDDSMKELEPASTEQAVSTTFEEIENTLDGDVDLEDCDTTNHTTEDTPEVDLEVEDEIDANANAIRIPTSMVSTKRMHDLGHKDTSEASEKLHSRYSKTTEIKGHIDRNATSSQIMSLSAPIHSMQISAVEWMHTRENSDIPGGILADPHGMGKMRTVIALCAERTSMSRDHIRDGKVVSSSTVIITLPCLLDQWIYEIQRSLFPRPRILCHAGGKSALSKKNVFEIAGGYDFIVTTYTALHKDVKRSQWEANDDLSSRSQFLSIFWNRIILDEFHAVHTLDREWKEDILLLEAKYRWIVSARPLLSTLLVPNLLLLRFLRHPVTVLFDAPPEGDLEWSPDTISLFMTSMEEVTLRRTECLATDEPVVPQLEKPSITYTSVALPMEETQKHFYTCVRNTGAAKLRLRQRTLQQMDANEHGEFSMAREKLLFDAMLRAHVFEMVMRLRQSTVHPCLAVSSLLQKRRKLLGDVSRAEQLQEAETHRQRQDEAVMENFLRKLGVAHSGKGRGSKGKKGHSKEFIKNVVQNLKIEAEENSEGSAECGICFEEYRNERGMLLPCGHRMCSACCRQVLNRHDSKCPFCKGRTGYSEAVAIPQNFGLTQSSPTEEPSSACNGPTIANLDLDASWICSSKTDRVVDDILQLRGSTEKSLVRFVVLTEFVPYVSILADAFAKKNIPTLILPSSVRRRMHVRNLIHGKVIDRRVRSLATPGTGEGKTVSDRPSKAKRRRTSKQSQEQDETCPLAVTDVLEPLIGPPVVIGCHEVFRYGLSLSFADHIFFMEPSASGPLSEYRVLTRACHVGRTRPLAVTRYVAEDSIESDILNLSYPQEMKGASGCVNISHLIHQWQHTQNMLENDSAEGTRQKEPGSTNKSMSFVNLSQHCLDGSFEELCGMFGVN